LDHLKQTPFYALHVAQKAKMVDFTGWALPVQYSSILEEHRAVRECAGLFDVSHMGEILVKGEGALDYLQNLLTNDFHSLKAGGCRYSVMCYENGTAVDDVLVYCFTPGTDYMVVVNASNADKDFAWMQQHVTDRVSVTNASDDYAQLALQGPKAEAILATLCDAAALPQKTYTFVPSIAVAGVNAIVSRSGYTGEDGFELYCSPADATALYEAIFKAGEPYGMLPCGLGARDTLRFEAAMPLYGHELSDQITPREVGLDFAIKTAKEQFIGKEALLAAPARIRVGLRLIDKGIAREHTEVLLPDGTSVGFVTSGGVAPSLGGNYAMALIDAKYADQQQFALSVRGRNLAAEKVALPFYKRK